jgi:chitinase
VQGWQWFENSRSVTHAPWFAPYVDVTATPSYPFEASRTSHDGNVVLSFIVANPEDPCAPSWGGAYSLDEANSTLDLDRRLARVKQHDGEAMISFGGQRNDELAYACDDDVRLLSAYTSVIDRYDVDVVDFDIEGDALRDASSVARRAAVIAELQEQRSAAGRPLAVWLTLPVTPNGLAQTGTDAVAATLEAGVDLAGVNVMVMDFGASMPKGESMADAAEAALRGTHRQLGALYERAGTSLTEATIWNKIGATPMIGQNDVRDEVFTLDDATQLNAFVLEQSIGRTSMWSLNRDVTCGPNHDDVHRVSDACSGVPHDDRTFTATLGAELTGIPSAGVGIETTSEPLPAEPTDDPAKSPYRIWNADTSYREGTKVVWHQNVYEAKWWTKGDLPDNPVLQAFETPWRLIGPVLPGETPIPVPTVPPGTYPEWSGAATYERGTRVLFDGSAYEAKWWTNGDSPQESAVDPDSSPWLALDAADVIATPPLP